MANIAKALEIHRLVDMDWKFGVTAANSSTAKLGTLFLQMKLVLDKGHGQRENKYIELSMDQFYEFLQSMEKASQSLNLMA